ncbi:MAG: TauD/TfdA family dioxygenase, partial [Myxococcota bacterium]|nr:TauD/TfdA family dioxygenase [Myxococcota bacterium]
MGFRHIRVAPLTGALGAEVEGVSLAGPLPDEVMAEVHRAFLDFAVLCFRDQELPPARQLAFARGFGEPEVHPIVQGTDEHPEVLRVFKPAGESASFGVGWHSDNSFFERPSLGTVLYGVTIPPFGGDTLFASAERAWEALSPAMQERLLGLRAVHSASRAYDPGTTGRAKYEGGSSMRYRWSEAVTAEVEHPLVRTHPETGRRCIYVNPMFTMRIAGMTAEESDALLGLLFAHVARPDFQCRVRWEPKS